MAIDADIRWVCMYNVELCVYIYIYLFIYLYYITQPASNVITPNRAYLYAANFRCDHLLQPSEQCSTMFNNVQQCSKPEM